MGQNVDDVNPLPIVPDLDDEPELVAADIEDRAIANRVGVREVAACFNQVCPKCVFGNAKPVFERVFGIGMNFPKFT